MKKSSSKVYTIYIYIFTGNFGNTEISTNLDGLVLLRAD